MPLCSLLTTASSLATGTFRNRSSLRRSETRRIKCFSRSRTSFSCQKSLPTSIRPTRLRNRTTITGSFDNIIIRLLRTSIRRAFPLKSPWTSLSFTNLNRFQYYMYLNEYWLWNNNHPNFREYSFLMIQCHYAYMKTYDNDYDSIRVNHDHYNQ